LRGRRRQTYNGASRPAVLENAAMGRLRPNIEAMEGYTPGYQPKEAGFIKLNTNESPYPPSPKVVAALRAAAQSALRKYPDPMGGSARAQAAALVGVKPEQVLCGNGSDDLLTIAMRTFCGEGDVVAFPTPTYSLYEVLARIQGARVAAVPFPEDYSLPKGLADTGARLVLVSNPNAPTGTTVPVDVLMDLAGRVEGVLLIDEAYVDFAPSDCMPLATEHENVVVTRTLSKSYSLAGLRFGYAVAQQPLIEGMTKAKDSYNVDALAIAGATAALADQEWLKANVEKVKATRERLIGRLDEMGFTCYPSQANFVLARVPPRCSAREVFEKLLERKIIVRYFDAPRLDDCIRISVGSDDEVDALLGALVEVLSGTPVGGS
jgi:histidinol-phosphate aminotransferase